jgi:hypothetical protein
MPRKIIFGGVKLYDVHAWAKIVKRPDGRRALRIPPREDPKKKIEDSPGETIFPITFKNKLVFYRIQESELGMKMGDFLQRKYNISLEELQKIRTVPLEQLSSWQTWLPPKTLNNFSLFGINTIGDFIDAEIGTIFKIKWFGFQFFENLKTAMVNRCGTIVFGGIKLNIRSWAEIRFRSPYRRSLILSPKHPGVFEGNLSSLHSPGEGIHVRGNRLILHPKIL